MKKLTIMKAFVLSLMVAMCTVMPLHAQTDGFFRGGNDSDYENRASQTNTITNYGIGETDPAPLGSGLLIMIAAGAGYAIARRKCVRKGMTMILAMVLLLGMTQCKKKIETVSSSNGLFITLDVSDGSKVVVTPGFTDENTGQEYAKVEFEAGDIIYVGNNRHYVGQLTYSNGVFSGTIDDSELTTADYFHFYFMGSKTPREQTASSITVDIINQTEKYPVISYARSSQFYHSDGEQIYTARLRNYCAIMKFTTPDIGANKAVKLKGVSNLVAVSFDQNYGDDAPVNPYTYGTVTDSEGAIIMHTVSGTERWAILLPNSPVTATATAAGYGATAAQPTLNTVTIPEIVENGYYRYHDNVDGYTINLAANGIIDGLISVSKTKQVYFCSGNVQYKANPETWRFALNQWDYVGAGNANISSTYDGWIDLFGWATSGWDNTGGANPGVTNDPKAANWQPWATDQTIYNDPNTGVADFFNPTHYGPTWDGTDPGDANHNNVTAGITGTNYDWGLYHTSGIAGVPQITNAGGLEWHACQWKEGCFFGGDYKNGNIDPQDLIGLRVKDINGTAQLIGVGTVNGVMGLIILPDKWDGSFDPNFKYMRPGTNPELNNYSENTTPRWSAMEAYGVAFFPAAGYRDGTTVTYAGYRGGYWSSDPVIYNFKGIVMHDDNNTILPATGHPLRSDAHVLKFFETGDSYWYDSRNKGFSVRLYHEID